ncbi:mannose-1-phosphate guanylyltransferase, partial [Candidatus Gracilibacteria bacterium]|nr:mannose-1-phosphate guanylyltransferase [Candidatus Gracilibacteria bacterium]
SKKIYIAINEKYLNLVKKLCPQIPEQNILVEPALRDTASCIGFGAALLSNDDPEEVMCCISADHIIQNKEEFQRKLQLAEEIAQSEETLNIVEVEAETPDTNYGYVKIGPETSPSVHKLDSFKEKPDLKTAKKFLADGNYLWNTGIYVWKISTLLDAYETHAPETYEKLMKMAEDPSTIKDIYPTLEKISIDYAIMEKVGPENIRIIKAQNLGWSDIGNWQAVHSELAEKPEDNITRGDVSQKDCTGCLIYADNNKPIKTIGLQDIIVVDTPKGLIISKKDQSKNIKDLL